MGSAESEQILLAVLPRVTGFMSMIGSGMIIYDVLFNPRRRKKIYHRIMCGLSVSDFVSSFVLIVPYEAWLHVRPISIGLGTGIAGIPLTLYNPADYICWIAEDPPGCDQDPAITCNRGSLAWLFRWVFFYGWIWAIFLFMATIMFLIFNKVRVQERALNKHRVKGQKKCRQRSRQVANQAMQYVSTYYITFFFGTLTRILQLAQHTPYFPIKVLFAIFFPLQGVFNAFIYFYSRRGWQGSSISISAASMMGTSFHSMVANPFTRRKGDHPQNRRSQKPTSAITSEVMLNNNTSGVGSHRAIITDDLVENEIAAMFQIPPSELELELLEHQDDDGNIDQDYESP